MERAPMGHAERLQCPGLGQRSGRCAQTSKGELADCQGDLRVPLLVYGPHNRIFRPSSFHRSHSMKSTVCIVFALGLAVLAPRGLSAQSRINPDDLIGTWQLMSRRNTRTGAI